MNHQIKCNYNIRYNLISMQTSTLLDKLKNGLLKTRYKLGYEITNLFKTRKIDDNLFRLIEDNLLVADVGFETTQKILNDLRSYVLRYKIIDKNCVYERLRAQLLSILIKVDHSCIIKRGKLYVVLVVGVNGVGKTTTVGKLAYKFKKEGYSVMLSAGDTFRMGAIEQLKIWADRCEVPIIAQHIGSDPSAVIFDSINAAIFRNIDILIIDTAGRLHNKIYLMQELKKIVKTMKKICDRFPDEVVLILDASIGQNSIQQVNLFNESIGITDIIITKLDGTAKGGVIFNIADKFRIPIHYLGIGENIEDIQIFQSNSFIKALFY